MWNVGALLLVIGLLFMGCGSEGSDDGSDKGKGSGDNSAPGDAPGTDLGGGSVACDVHIEITGDLTRTIDGPGASTVGDGFTKYQYADHLLTHDEMEDASEDEMAEMIEESQEDWSFSITAETPDLLAKAYLTQPVESSEAFDGQWQGWIDEGQAGDVLADGTGASLTVDVERRTDAAQATVVAEFVCS